MNGIDACDLYSGRVERGMTMDEDPIIDEVRAIRDDIRAPVAALIALVCAAPWCAKP